MSVTPPPPAPSPLVQMSAWVLTEFQKSDVLQTTKVSGAEAYFHLNSMATSYNSRQREKHSVSVWFELIIWVFWFILFIDW